MTDAGARGTPGSQTADERIFRHQHAAEILRARSILVVACSLWLVVGAALDFATHRYIGTGSLTFVLLTRLATTGFHGFVIGQLFRSPLPSPRFANALIAMVFPVTSFALMLIATQMGGLGSPYISAVFVVIMGQAIALPGHWKRGSLLVSASTFVYPIGLLVATRFDATLAAQLHDTAVMTQFITWVAVLGAGAIVIAWGGHIMWSLRRSVFESRNIGRYRLLKRIGKGGMGEVWRAEDRALRRNVALKLLSPEHGRSPASIARFEREIQATASIVHPNVVRIHDWGITDDGVWYYAMDMLDGVDLMTVIKRCGPMPPALALHLGLPCARGLAEAHRRGIIHRDVKPGNVFVVAPGNEPERLELLDFGIAYVESAAELTQAGAVMGTPGFMAPEVVAGVGGGVRADVYGFAATLYFALTGTNPVDANHAPVSQLIAGIPVELDDAIVRCLDAEPTRRPASIDELVTLLEAAELPWTGSWRIDRSHGTPIPVEDDPTVDPEAPATQVEAGRGHRASRDTTDRS